MQVAQKSRAASDFLQYLLVIFDVVHNSPRFRSLLELAYCPSFFPLATTAMEVLREAPKTSTFIPLVEHQSSTPASFYTGPPVLHYHSDRSKIIILERDASGTALLEPLLRQASAPGSAQTNGGVDVNGDGEGQSEQKVIENVDVWVTSA